MKHLVPAGIRIDAAEADQSEQLPNCLRFYIGWEPRPPAVPFSQDRAHSPSFYVTRDRRHPSNRHLTQAHAIAPGAFEVPQITQQNTHRQIKERMQQQREIAPWEGQLFMLTYEMNSIDDLHLSQ
jgi:hypothetical protein